MKKIIVSIIVIGFLFTTSIASITALGTKESQKGQELQFHAIPYANIYVDDSNTQGPWDGTYERPFKTIRDGINAASDNDTVFVFNGTYKENLYINKSIDLIGENRETTTIDGGRNGDTIWVNSSFLKISGFNVINSSDDAFSSGIQIIEKGWWFPYNPPKILSNVSISNCIMENDGCGRLNGLY